MRVTFLGTGASPSNPLPFCNCDNCVKARSFGGRNIRKRSALAINYDLAVDLGPDVVSSSLQYGFRLENIKYCFVTHPHSDHIDISHIASRHPEFGGIVNCTLEIYCSAPTLEQLDVQFKAECDYGSLRDEGVLKKLNLQVFQTREYEELEVGDYVVIPFPANHEQSTGSQIFSIKNGESEVLYATDTAGLDETTWTYMKERDKRYEAVMLDHTYGDIRHANDHLGIDTFFQHVKRFRKEGLLKPNGRVLATHISHEGNPIHNELEKLAHSRGYEIAYDGMIVEL